MRKMNSSKLKEFQNLKKTLQISSPSHHFNSRNSRANESLQLNLSNNKTLLVSSSSSSSQINVKPSTSTSRSNSIESLSNDNGSPKETNSSMNHHQTKITNKRAFYTSISDFKDEAAADEYIRDNNSYPITITNNNPTNCTCCSNSDKHKMFAKYLKCSCKNEWCNLRYVIKRCFYSQTCYLAQSGAHADPNSINRRPEEAEKVSNSSDTTNSSAKKSYGIALVIQKLLAGWLEEDNFITPRQLMSRLTYNKNILPSLKQVSFFLFLWISNRNSKFHD